MTWIYPPILADEQDALLAEDWERNFGALAGVFNGGIDRDNLPEGGVQNEHVRKYAANKIYSDGGDSSTSVAADTGTTEWQNGDGDGLPLLEQEAPVDALLLCHFSASWTWDDSAATTTAQQNRICCKWRIIVNGTTVAESGWSPLYRTDDSIYLVGAIPVSAGAWRARAQLRIAKVTYSEDTTADDISSEDIADFPLAVDGRELLIVEKRR